MSHGPRIIETLVEFTIVCKCDHCGKPSSVSARWIRLASREVDAEVAAGPCPWCQQRGMSNAGKPPKYQIPKAAIMSYYEDRFGAIVGRGYLPN